MRKIVLLLGLCLISAAMLHPASANPRAYARAGTGAGALWWSHGQDHGVIHYVTVWRDYTDDGLPRTTASYYKYSCGVKKGMPHGCNINGSTDRVRLNVDDFYIDPTLEEARLVAHRNGRRVSVQWQGRGERHPIAFEWADESVFVPYRARAWASAAVGIFRAARTEGEVLGRRFAPSPFGQLATWGYGAAGACVGLSCLP